MNQANVLRSEFWVDPRQLDRFVVVVLKTALEKSYRKTKKNISLELVFYLFLLFSVGFLEREILSHIYKELFALFCFLDISDTVPQLGAESKLL